jgi:hypothetical protein
MKLGKTRKAYTILAGRSLGRWIYEEQNKQW